MFVSVLYTKCALGHICIHFEKYYVGTKEYTSKWEVRIKINSVYIKTDYYNLAAES